MLDNEWQCIFLYSIFMIKLIIHLKTKEKTKPEQRKHILEKMKTFFNCNISFSSPPSCRPTSLLAFYKVTLK